MSKYWLFFVALFGHLVHSQNLPTLPTDYGSATLEISSAVFDLNKKWIVPNGNSEITEMGAWITPKASGYTILAALIFDLNTKALSNNYQNSLKNLVELSYQKLPNNVGQLFRYSYNYNDLGTSDVTSIRFTAMGVGMNPEQSLAFGPIDQISQAYDENAVYPIESVHYVWVYKKQDGSLTLSTIKEPFINNLKAKALGIKIKMLEEPVQLPSATDENIKKFEESQKWIDQTNKYKAELEKQDRIKEVENLNLELKRKQEEFNSLNDAYNNALSENNKLSTIIQFIDVCQSVTQSLSNNSSNIQSSEKAMYNFEKTYLDDQIKNLNTKVNNLSNDLNKTIRVLKRIFTEANIPPPLP